MVDLIRVLPPQVANQIAAGEVVQRPASIVKELMENAVDAGATAVRVLVKEGGRTLVQVIDNGVGMSAPDAVRAFARHATSKIRKADDLFALHTFGFRGEALASVAAVAEVELRTRQVGDELGTLVKIAGSTTAQSEPASAAHGTQITVRNLFFNTPARRKFLKSNLVETKQILAEFQRVALCHPDRSFTLIVDDKTLLDLTSGNLAQRISAVVGRRTGEKLLDVSVDSPSVRISGYIGLPSTARKQGGEQYLFVNGRYFRSPYLQKAVVSGYNRLLPPGYTPAFFLYFTVDPARLDVNIHPQKTEVKFEDEQLLWQMLASAVASSLGKHNVTPMLDFEQDTTVEIPPYTGPRTDVSEPPAAVNPTYNPFRSYQRSEWDAPQKSHPRSPAAVDPEQIPFTEQIPAGLRQAPPRFDERADQPADAQQQWHVFESPAYGAPEQAVLPLGGDIEVASLACTARYLVTTTADGVVVIDQLRARQRILYEALLEKLDNDFSVGQRELFPESIELSPADHHLLMGYAAELSSMGFDLRDLGGSTLVVYGLPLAVDQPIAPAEAIERLLTHLKAEGNSLRDNLRQGIAAALARSCTPHTAPLLDANQRAELIRQLFACREPHYTPDSLPIITTLSLTEIKNRLKK